jgi:hypothetical protein
MCSDYFVFLILNKMNWRWIDIQYSLLSSNVLMLPNQTIKSNCGGILPCQFRQNNRCWLAAEWYGSLPFVTWTVDAFPIDLHVA